MTTTYDTDPNTATVAAAWASSPLGQPEREVRYGFATADPAESDEPKPLTKRAILAAALASGVIGGAVLGVALFDFNYSSQPNVVEQGPVPGPALVVVDPTTTAPAPTQAVQGPAVMPAPAHGPGSAGVATPPAPSDSPVVVDIPTPENSPLPPTSEHPEPEDPPAEPPSPVPPVPEDLDFKLPETDPEPVPPVVQPDLPLAPAPEPDPGPQPPNLPDFDLQAPVKP